MYELKGKSLEWAGKRMDAAWEAAKKSNCEDAQYGAVIMGRLSDNPLEILATGYNHVPRPWEYSCKDCPRRKLDLHGGVGFDLCYSVHAEQHAIINLPKEPLPTNLSIFIAKLKNGEKQLDDAKPVCTGCAKLIVESKMQYVTLAKQSGFVAYDADEFYTLSFRNAEENFRALLESSRI